MRYLHILIAIFFTIQGISQVSAKKQRAIDSAYQIASTKTNPINLRLDAYRYCCWKTVYLDFNQGLKNSSEYLALAKITTQYDNISKAYHFLGHSQIMLGQFEEAEETLQEGLEFSRENDCYRGIAEIHGDLGNLNHNLGNMELALKHHFKALDYALTYNSTVEYARAKINIGEIYEAQANYKLSIETLEEALNYCKYHNFLGFKSSIYESLGDVNVTIKEYKTAEKNYLKAVEFGKRLHNNNRLINSLNKLGELHLEQNNLQNALNYFKEALDAAISIKAIVLEAKIRTNLARLHLLQKNSKEALAQINLALHQFEALKIKDDLDKAYIIAAKTHNALNNKKERNAYYQKAYTIAHKSNHIISLKKASLGLGRAYEESGDLQNAIKYYKKYNAFSNQIRDEDGIKEIIRLDMQDLYKQKTLTDSINKINEIKLLKFEYNKKEERSKLKNYIAISSVITLLFLVLCVAYFYNQKKKIAVILAKKNKVINQALKDKEILLKEVHHRVKNNMQVASSLLHLKSKNTKDKIAKEALLDSKKRIDAMQLIHQKMYQKGNYQQIDVYEYFNDIVTQLLKPIKTPQDHFIVHGQALWLDVEQAQALGFILHELIVNSIKHAWNNTEAKKIEISISKTGNEILFAYTDNGKGLPEHIDLANTKSFGLKLIYSLSTRQLLGNLSSNNTNGFSIKIKFDAR
ncbi:tetratricopeptide repeat protein [Lacinutrix sp. C3R15]|uniref:tetratricopeptide repeat-containing sensor histidine kinase n=1 Tax=Flavobacteriaceae TaxID=49546 RepID=UPI001C080C04|nr:MULTISPECIES: tetratricopeptide repeat protein [Flavobacteriaceae]MBU2940002.1 tetratricopeptide repeat protein [Lacinutrix sp. C3R15]MDO6623319.1 tetratricopeptide repeat protein [Oceanihabitans sp. 1_MG-2023]